MAWKTTYLGSVNRWECDENDHLNVRFYLEKATQAVESFLAAKSSESARIVHAHFRFLNEARVATPITGRCATVEAETEAGELGVQCELTRSSDGQILAAMIFRVRISSLPDDTAHVALSEYARPRGLVMAEPDGLPPTLDDAIQLGFRPIGAGIVRPDECDSSGVMMPWCYLGRISDGIPNLWFEANDLAGASSLGGAVLEYRMRESRPLERADRFTVASAIVGIGAKTYRILHLAYEVEGALSLCAEAIGVTMDLDTRRAVPPPPEKRRQLEELRVSGFD